jgi:hypothetical protein
LFLFGENGAKQLGIDEHEKLNKITNDILKKFKIDVNNFKKLVAVLVIVLFSLKKVNIF